MEVLSALYPWTKSLHIIAMVAWMAGLFYLPRLFVHHVERGAADARTAEIFVMMEDKLLRVIMNPAMIATWLFGLLLLATPGIVAWGDAGWIHVKLATVVVLTVFHMWLARCRRRLAAGTNTVTGRSYRLMNELPTLALVVIVVMVVVKPF